MNPLVTIVIPIYKVEKFIERCLQSVVNQGYKNIECILVNDVTPDASMEIAEKFIQKNQDFNFVVFNQPTNQGLSMARNVGMDKAKGEYIYFLDSDDEILPDAIESLVELSEKTKAEISMGEVQGVKIPSNEKVDVFPIHTKVDFLQGNIQILQELVNGGFAVSSWNKLISVDFLRFNNMYFTKGLYAQDSLHTFEMGLHLETLAFLRQKTYVYYLHEDSVIHNRKKVHFDNWITIAEKINEHYVNEKDTQRKKLILEYLINFKATTLQMNWKAQQNEELWKYSYKAYSKLKKLSLQDYFSSDYSTKLKKQDLFYRLPLFVGYRFFRWRFDR
ncbi:glycosyltransferase [Epilithonimonas hispanica]|uniref:Glycosyl transferase family 2 n=1 Tax=Epilithonimonas hispanica TaxID=358687 RepID=A0A3D9D1M2_9FLAO|nr:glycosyltransferase [Epilithonimonas hispanica]REC71913.1 glycosyl transferase family 2 [Epilithonimonas hispanica]